DVPDGPPAEVVRGVDARAEQGLGLRGVDPEGPGQLPQRRLGHRGPAVRAPLRAAVQGLAADRAGDALELRHRRERFLPAGLKVSARRPPIIFIPRRGVRAPVADAQLRFSIAFLLGIVPALVGGLLLFGLSLTFVLASTGAIIGFGASQGKVLGYYVRAFLVRFSHLAILMFFFLYDPGDNPAAPKDPIAAILSLAASLVFAGIVYAFVYREVLPETLPKDIRRELLRWPGKAERPAKESE